jgi:mono/diheme cytochrome c family protein
MSSSKSAAAGLRALFLLAAGTVAGAAHAAVPTRVIPRPYLFMPPTAEGRLPPLLSQTGVFKDTPNLVPSDGLIPYDLIVSFWSDGAAKQRWISVPKEKIGFAPTGEWTFPAGTVFVKTFELPLDAAHPDRKRRLETRLLVRDGHGGVYGVVYKWRADNSDADLLSTSLSEDISVKAADGSMHTQTWYYPSRQNCLECHNARAGGVLGVKTRQLNHDFPYPSGVRNELQMWNDLGLFSPSFKDDAVGSFTRLAAATDTSRSLEDRARSYFDANCSQCHRPGGTVANFDARYDTPLEQHCRRSRADR